MIGAQLPLAVQLRDSASFDTYFAGPNADLVAALRELAGPTVIFGSSGCGRTHLLQAVARLRPAPYLPLRELAPHGAAILDGFASAGALCVDDFDHVTRELDWALALLRLLDTMRARGAVLLLACSAPPERIACALPDLRTRLQACACFGIKPLTDEDRRQLLRERARGRGLEMPDELARWLISTQARDAGSLVAALDRLDQASFIAKRRLTLPFAQSVLSS